LFSRRIDTRFPEQAFTFRAALILTTAKALFQAKVILFAINGAPCTRSICVHWPFSAASCDAFTKAKAPDRQLRP
jgi:hypothetical protein